MVAGQVYDYVMLMKMQGNSDPLVVLTSVQETYVCWLNEESPLAEQQRTLLLPWDEQRSVEEVVNDAGSSITASLPKTVHIQKDKPGATSSSFEPYEERKIVVSKQAYDSSDLVRVLCSAIECGLRVKPAVASTEDPFQVPSLGLMKESYVWGELVVKKGAGVTFQTNKWPKGFFAEVFQEKPMYLIIAAIGAGPTSKVFQALNRKGEHCAIKLYCASEKDGRTLDDEDYVEATKDQTTTEVACAKAIYKSRKHRNIADCFSSEKLNSVYCLVMPFFPPVTKEDREKIQENKNSELDKIRELLRAMLRAGKMFPTWDLLWRHIGKHPFDDGEYGLFGFAHLDEVQKVIDTKRQDEIIEAQIAQLLEEQKPAT